VDILLRAQEAIVHLLDVGALQLLQRAARRRQHFHILRPLPKQVAYPLNRLHHRLLMRIILPTTLDSVSSLYLALLEYQLSSLICSRS
jgi:hypothetical protein